MGNIFVVRGVAVLLSMLAFQPVAEAEPTKLEGVVNINTASPEQLELLPGVGPAKARLIVEYREKHAFRTVEELARVKGIGPKTVRRLRPNLVVRGDTTAHPAGRPPLKQNDSPAQAPAPSKESAQEPTGQR
jgi:competence protein ComEA